MSDALIPNHYTREWLTAVLADEDRSAPMRVAETLPPGAGPCIKQTVQALVVTPNGDCFEGTNWCANPQQVCPRKDMPTGQGYELCRDICKQSGHAEVNAIRLAGPRAKGAVLSVSGHTYACEGCKQAARDAGIIGLVVDGKREPISPYEPRTTFAGASPFVVNPLDHEQTK